MAEPCPACHRFRTIRVERPNQPPMMRCQDCAAQWEVPEVHRRATPDRRAQGGRDESGGKWGGR